MDDILNLFYKLTNIKPLKYEIIKDGITNKNYKVYTDNNSYVLRIPRENMIGIDYVNQGKVLKLVKDLSTEVIYYDDKNGILITKFVDNIINEKVSFQEVSNNLKKIHSLPIEGIKDFDPFYNLSLYKKEVSVEAFLYEGIIILHAKDIYKKYKKVLCHNDVLYANFIKTHQKTYLIDYEYAGKNIALFDIASFLSENNIEDIDKQKEFLSLYFTDITDDLLNDLHIMFSFLDILWGYWAFAMYKKYEENIFFEIAKEKMLNYRKRNNLI